MEKNVIKIETFSKGRGDASTGVEVWRKITRVIMPENLMPEKAAAMELIKEAFEVHGILWYKPKKVNFDYIESPVFIREVKS